VLRYVARGAGDKEIARALGLSPRTVEMHVARVLAALRVRNRSQAVSRAHHWKLLLP
jgi:DNA-binding NarL/FixJ family response regulator